MRRSGIRRAVPGPAARGAALVTAVGLVAAGAVVALGLRPAPAEPAAAPDPFVLIGRFPLTDLSGVVASRQHPGVVWAIRDGGDGDVRNVLYAGQVADGTLRPFPSGELFRPVTVAGAANTDWEDITVDDDGHLYIGDIGNNGRGRTDLRVYQVPEPDPFAATEAAVTATYPFSWPRGNPDAESLFWTGGHVYIIAKRTPPAPQPVYRLSGGKAGGPSTLAEVATLTEPGGDGFAAGEERIAGASISADGTRFALVTNRRTYVYAAGGRAGDAGDANVASLVSRPPAWAIPHRAGGGDEQVEGVAFVDGFDLVTVSELRGQFRYGAMAAYEAAGPTGPEGEDRG